MTKQIKYILLLPLLCFSCHAEKHTKVEEITYFAAEKSKSGIILGINSLFFLTPKVGFSFMEVRKKLGEYPIGTLFRKTTDGGKTWETLSSFSEYFTGIQYWNGIFYAYYTEYSKNQSSPLPLPSCIFFSTDMGETWKKLYEFDDYISNFHVFDAQNMSIIKRENERKCIYKSRDGGKTWKKVDGVPDLNNSSYFPRDSNKLYFSVGNDSLAFRETYLYDYDVINGKLSRQLFKVNSIPVLYISDEMLSIDMNGCNVMYFTLKDNKFKLLSKIRWGAWFRGSIRAKPLAKDGKYVFSFISQFPGRSDMTSVLFFSETGGKKWREIRTFEMGDGIAYQEYNIYKDDTIFQIAYASRDSLKIFRIKKN